MVVGVCTSSSGLEFYCTGMKSLYRVRGQGRGLCFSLPVGRKCYSVVVLDLIALRGHPHGNAFVCKRTCLA